MTIPFEDDEEWWRQWELRQAEFRSTTLATLPNDNDTPTGAIELFYVFSVLREFHGQKNVRVHWFVESRDVPLDLPYAEMIRNFDSNLQITNNIDPRSALQEMFTEPEAIAFQEYLGKNRKDNAFRERANLPIDPNTGPFTAIPVGGPQGFLTINWSSDQLAFAVNGYYDLQHTEPEPNYVLEIREEQGAFVVYEGGRASSKIFRHRGGAEWWLNQHPALASALLCLLRQSDHPYRR